MKVVLVIYVGIQYFLQDDFEPDKDEAGEVAQAELVEAAFNQGEVRVELDGLGIAWNTPTLELEAVLGDEEPGLPFLAYINATFTPAVEDEEMLLEVEDDLDDHLSAVLYAGSLVIPFDGIIELESEDD